MWILLQIDDHEDVINQYESMITTGIVGDITELDLLDAADIGNCDTVVIATGEKPRVQCTGCHAL